MKLTYWMARCIGDSDVYSIRAKTRKEAVAKRKAYGEAGFGEPVKVQIEYADAFDLMNECMTEGRGWWESEAAAVRLAKQEGKR